MSLVSDLLSYDGAIESVKIFRNVTMFSRLPGGARKEHGKANVVRVTRKGCTQNIVIDINESLNSNAAFRQVLRVLYGRS